MTVENINDGNYQAFRDSQRAVLVLSTSWCHFCEEYKPVLDSLSEALPSIKFGDAVLDQGHLIGVKRDFSDIIEEGVPATILFREGKDFGYFMGPVDFDTGLEFFTEQFLNREAEGSQTN